MYSESEPFSGYDFRESMVVGAAASLSPIFSFLFFAYISYHPVFNTTTIDEMVSYAQIFLISFFSYFTVALAVLKFGKSLAKNLPVWVPISILGSILCVNIFAVWELREAGGIAQIAWWILYSTFFLTVISSIFTAIALSIMSYSERDPSIKLHN